jgi:hypothetical protein
MADLDQREIKARLQGVKKGGKWGEAVEDAAKNSFGNLPVGRYSTELSETKIDTDPDGQLRAVMIYTVTEGEHINKKMWIFHNLQNPDRWKWFVIDMLKFGITHEQLSDPTTIPDLLQLLVDYKFQCTIRRSDTPNKNPDGKPYENSYLDKVLGATNAPEEDRQTQKTDHEEDNPEEDAGDDYTVGQTVNFKVGRNTLQGVISEVNDEDLTISCDGRTYSVDRDKIVE